MAVLVAEEKSPVLVDLDLAWPVVASQVVGWVFVAVVGALLYEMGLLQVGLGYWVVMAWRN